jgi:hypothetical protein
MVQLRTLEAAAVLRRLACGHGFSPVAFKAERDEEVIFCGCKHTGTGRSATAPTATCRRLSRRRPAESGEPAGATGSAGTVPTVKLDGQCYVFSTARAALSRRGVMEYAAVISPAMGALYQSQFYAKVDRGASPVISADGRHTVLFVTAGDGEIEISGRRFTVGPLTGVYIRPSEAYRMHADDAADGIHLQWAGQRGSSLAGADAEAALKPNIRSACASRSLAAPKDG